MDRRVLGKAGIQLVQRVVGLGKTGTPMGLDPRASATFAGMDIPTLEPHATNRTDGN